VSDAWAIRPRPITSHGRICQPVEVHVLLEVRANEIVKGVAGDRQDGLTITLRVIRAVQQVDPSGTGGLLISLAPQVQERSA
jgi:hypothetical protein